MGVARLLANAATLLRYAIGECAIAVAAPRLDLVGRVLPSAVLAPHDKGVLPDIVLCIGELSAGHRKVLKVVLVPGTTKRALEHLPAPHGGGGRRQHHMEARPGAGEAATTQATTIRSVAHGTANGGGARGAAWPWTRACLRQGEGPKVPSLPRVGGMATSSIGGPGRPAGRGPAQPRAGATTGGRWGLAEEPRVPYEPNGM